eukprot:SM000108S14235  [mRNA]  locus=s108:416702:419356:- [translate_table: standard]
MAAACAAARTGSLLRAPASTQVGATQTEATRTVSKVSAQRSSFRGASLRGLTPLPVRSLRAKRLVTTAVAVPAVTTTQIPGFTQIGEEVPDGISMSDVLKTIPKEAYEVNDLKAFRSVVTTFGAVALGYAALAVAPWYLYPLVYAYMSAAVTGLFVIGHDCGHNSFSRSQLVNDVVGTLVFAPLVYPFEPWRIKHNTHHSHTNKLLIDTAWQPFTPRMYRRSGALAKTLMHIAMGPTWWVASVGHWGMWHFDLNKFRPQEKPKVLVSWAAVGAFAAFALLPLLITTGPVGFVKWWGIPFLGFHFWMSTFTLVHHTAPHIPFKNAREWELVKAQLGGTVHCEYPKWIEVLCHDISVHIPHHLSTKIPSYNLRLAYDAIEKNWNKYLNKATFGLPLMSTIVNQCNLFDPDRKEWVTFERGSVKPQKVV